jgi:ParB-like chromosome segregation protein Spo0J
MERFRRKPRARGAVGRNVVMRPLSELLPSIRNPRQHSPAHVSQIAASIREFGFTIPLLVDERGELIAGHGRLLAAKQLGLRQVPVLTATGWSAEQKRAYRIADNRLTEAGRWDDRILREELEALRGEFPLAALGFELSELDALMQDGSPLPVEEIETGDVADRFWLVVKGPLERQAEALNRLKALMADLDGVTVEAGTVEAMEGLA